MATLNLKRKTIGLIEIQSGNGTPDHISPLGSLYTDVDTGVIYKNQDGFTLWVSGFGGNGSSGSSGSSGGAGSSGAAGSSGSSGTNGSSGSSGNGTAGSSGSSGVDGTSGSAGSSGVNGTSGSAGSSGVNGTSGSAGSSGTNGSSGSSGNGTAGSSGSSGVDGTSGSAGSSGANGTSGSAGSSGANGTSGSAGSSGTNGSSGSSGNGTAGSSGSSGVDGSGVDGTSGSAGSSGANGTSGSAGSSGAVGMDGSNSIRWNYAAGTPFGSPGSTNFIATNAAITSITRISISVDNLDSINVDTWLTAIKTFFDTGAKVYIQLYEVNDFTIFGIFQLTVITDNTTYWDWNLSNVAGNGSLTTTRDYAISWMVQGANGSAGSSGANGTSGSSGANGTSGSAGSSGANGTSGSAGSSGANGTAGSAGSSGNGTAGSSGSSGIVSVAALSNTISVIRSDISLLQSAPVTNTTQNPITRRFLAAATTVSAAVMTNVAGLSVSVEANTYYKFEIGFMANRAAAAQVYGYGVTFPAVNHVRGFAEVIHSVVNAGIATTVRGYKAGFALDTAGSGSVLVSTISAVQLSIYGRICGIINPTATGVLQFQAKASAGATGQLVVLAGSYIEVWKIGA